MDSPGSIGQATKRNCPEHGKMSDLIYVGLTLAFFGLTVGFIAACERLMGNKK